MTAKSPVGDLADDRVSGLSCSDCGVYFKHAHGYPVLCRSCWQDWTPEQRYDEGVQRATVTEP